MCEAEQIAVGTVSLGCEMAEKPEIVDAYGRPVSDRRIGFTPPPKPKA